MYISGQFHGDEAAIYALRLPFIWAFALLIGYIIECVVYDINKNIQYLQERYHALIQSIDSPVFMLDSECNLLYVNDKMLSELGVEEEQILNKNFSTFHSPEESKLFQSNLESVLKKNKPTQFVSHNPDKDRWSLNVLSPVREFTTGAIEAVSAVSKDITENVKSERALRNAYDRLKKTQDQLIQKNKMEAVGRMASGIAHQIRNPLEIIVLGVEFLEELGYKKNELAQESMNKIKSATHRANRIINDVLQFSRSSDFSFETVDIRSLLEESLEFTQHKLSQANTQVTTSFNHNGLLVLADKTTLQQVFLNILNNAVEAMGSNGSLHIRTYVQPFSQTEASGARGINLSEASFDKYAVLGRRQGLSRLQRALRLCKDSPGNLMISLVELKVTTPQTQQRTDHLDEYLMRTIESRFVQSIRENDFVVHLTSNIFLCLLQELPDEQATSSVGNRILNTLTEPIVSKQQIHLSASLGYTLYPTHGENGKTVLKQAKAALDVARTDNQQVVGYHELNAEHLSKEETYPPNPTTVSAGSGSLSDSWVVVEIEDNGPGMPEEVASNIFEPFYTTKQAEKGTGLGLSIASLIIERHRGHIELESKEGEVTKFRIKLLPADKGRKIYEQSEKNTLGG